jgi:D-amino peptidase
MRAAEIRPPRLGRAVRAARRGAAGLVLCAGLAASPGCQRAAPPPEAWIQEPAHFDTTGGIQVLVVYDMEGVSGLGDWHMFDANYDEYARGRELLTDDVNAVVEGLFAGGADEVDLVDGHGSGNPGPDVLFERLDPRAMHLVRPHPFDEFDLPGRGGYDAVAVVGMHGKPGSGGFAPHTMGIGVEVSVNDRAATETEIIALLWGEVGVPVFLASGDDALARDLAGMPWMEVVVVKTATSASSATLRPAGEARAELTAAARRAVGRLDSMRIVRPRPPVHLTVRAHPPASLRLLDGVPGVGYRDGAVSFETQNLAAAKRGLNAVLGVASASFADIGYEQLDAAKGQQRSLREFWQMVSDRWLDYESGRWKPETAAPDSGRVYYGAP